ncbi:hypothetical protein ACTMU2_35250 [Cupriavidus basilensis]
MAEGLIPLTLQALERAIELNGVAVEKNKAAFDLHRHVRMTRSTCCRRTGKLKTSAEGAEVVKPPTSSGACCWNS